MATVYRALHLNLDREVAIKVMDPAMNSDETFSERFIREARISARLNHPHILQIYDVNSYDGVNYIAMELLTGGELADFIHGAMPQKQIYQIVRQLADALDYASGRGYVHRDIKPSNIMLRGEEDFVLADFGIARAANSGTQMTQTGLMVGTPSYMSPEQARGQKVDGRSDLYALGVLVYEMLTKTLPYESDSAVSTAVKHLTDDIPTLPEKLAVYQNFIDKGLAKSADQRFQTGRELYESFMTASKGFADDEVLTEAAEPVAASGFLAPGDGTEKASLAGNDPTPMSNASFPALSHPSRLDGSIQRERLVSGTYSRGNRSAAGAGTSLVRIALIVAVLGGAGYGAYFSSSGALDRYQAEIDLLREEQKLAAAQSERMAKMATQVDDRPPLDKLLAEADDAAAAIAADSENGRREREAEAARAREQQLAAEVQAREAAASGIRAANSGALDIAQQSYDEVVQTYPDLDAVKSLEQALREGYARAARAKIDLREFDSAEQLIARAAANFPGDERWDQLQTEIEVARSSSHRRLGAY